MCTVVCSQSSFFRKIIEIERFPLRAAILHECEDNLGSGGIGIGLCCSDFYLTVISDPRHPRVCQKIKTDD